MRSSPRRASAALGTFLLVFALLHAYWAAGGSWGLSVALGGPSAPRPGAAAIWGMAGVLLVAAALVGLQLVRQSRGRRVPWLVRVAVGALALAALAVAGTNAVAGATAGERFVIAPAALLVALLAALSLRSGRRGAAPGVAALSGPDDR